MIRGKARFMEERRFGKVVITQKLIADLDDDDLLALYSSFGVILRTEDRLYDLMTELIIANPKLDRIEENSIIPDYLVLFDSRTKQFSFKRQNPGSDMVSLSSPLSLNDMAAEDEDEVVI